MSEEIMDKSYNPHEVEKKWYAYWMEKDYFRADENGSERTFSIVIPPPNITGSLHMGHALNNTLQDILVRYKRMQGYNTLWVPGTDHAGIATQNVVEKQLAQEGKSRQEIGREQFVERVWKWKEEFGGIIIKQLMRLGASCDWSRQRFTMDEGLSRAVREVFVRLYEEGLIYRDNYIINWCPRCQTALSDLEVEHEEVKGNLYYIAYPSADGNGSLVVATTRPETMLGDTAVAVNPIDKRYRDWIGKKVILPLVNKEIPVIADEYVTLDFGTGALKITPAHDPNDFLIGIKHSLEMVKVIGNDGKMSDEAGRYKGLDRFECRKKVLEDLKADGLLEKVEECLHQVGHCYRCKTMVEPNLSLQWFVKVKPLAEKATEAVKNGDTRIFPRVWEKTYFEWMENIRDWCISRQIWWGHRIPAWYCQDCKGVTVAKEDPQKCSLCGGKSIQQDNDVLDTWFSSALWPFTTLGWPAKTNELKLFYPTSVLVTGFDILFFWVARMMMMGLKFMDQVPFRDVYIHALVRDVEGQKMSKSKGNVIDPLEVIDKFGTDSFRFTLAALAIQGRDVRLSEERIEGYRHFVNKLWNASRFTIMNLADFNPDGFTPDPEHFTLADQWIVSRLNRVIVEVEEALENYKFNEAATSIYQFTWHEFCDWYVELSKLQLYQTEDVQGRLTTQYLLRKTLITLVEMLHPIMPFVTEEIWQKFNPGKGSVMVASYPKCEREFLNERAEQDMGLLIEIITAIRNIRAEMGVAPSGRVDAILFTGHEKASNLIMQHQEYLRNLARVNQVVVKKQGERPRFAAVALVQDIEIFVPLEGVINIEEEKRRLRKDLDKVEKDLSLIEKKLSNPEFLHKAPGEVVEKVEKEGKELREKQEKLLKRLTKIEQLK
jgi:valyl-tRNA synthetase